MRLIYRCLAMLVMGCSVWTSGVAADPKSAFTPEFKFSAPLPATLKAAQKAGIPTSEFNAAADRTELRSGDSITAVVSLTDNGTTLQYVVQFTAVDLTEKEQLQPAIKDLRYYTSSGNEFDFAGKRAALVIRMLGPVKSGARDDEKAARSAKDTQVRVLVNKEYLKLGFDQACSAWLRIRDAAAHLGSSAKTDWSADGKPFPPERVSEGRKAAELFGITVADERALTGTMPALLEFFLISINTVELRDVIRDVADIPWFTILKNGGKNMNLYVHYVPPFGVLDSAVCGQPPEARTYFMPLIFSLYGKPVLACRLAVTAPRPPLLTSAGIVGVAAQRPDGKGPHLMIQIVATRCAPENLEKISVK